MISDAMYYYRDSDVQNKGPKKFYSDSMEDSFESQINFETWNNNWIIENSSFIACAWTIFILDYSPSILGIFSFAIYKKFIIAKNCYFMHEPNNQ